MANLKQQKAADGMMLDNIKESNTALSVELITMAKEIKKLQRVTARRRRCKLNTYQLVDPRVLKPLVFQLLESTSLSSHWFQLSTSA